MQEVKQGQKSLIYYEQNSLRNHVASILPIVLSCVIILLMDCVSISYKSQCHSNISIFCTYSVLSSATIILLLSALVKRICGLFLTNDFIVLIKEKILFSMSVLLPHACFISLIKGKILFLNSLMLSNFNLTKLCSMF